MGKYLSLRKIVITERSSTIRKQISEQIIKSRIYCTQKSAIKIFKCSWKTDNKRLKEPNT